MNINVVKMNNQNIAVVSSDHVIINNVQDSLDLMATVRHNYDCDKVIINKKNVTEDFFELKTCVAGEIMQKYINYGMRLAIIGDFEQYGSKSLKAFIYESNKANQIIFKSTIDEILESWHTI